MSDELKMFLNLWDAEARKTADLLRALPAKQYDFRPDVGGRSLGELAWHLAEVDAYVTFNIEQGASAQGKKPPGFDRPKSIDALAPGYERIHADAAARVRRLTVTDLDRKVRDFGGGERTIRDQLWSDVLLHTIHHRGQLSMLCRLAGAAAPGLYGPNREEMARLRAKRAG
jgi:uncharacterized damage-inducible protein DinB